MFAKNKNGCFDCDRCPQNADPSKGRWCPAWWETVWRNHSTGETRVDKSCGFRQLPKYLEEFAAANRSAAAAVESTRNEMGRGLARVAGAVVPVMMQAVEAQRLEHLNGSSDEDRD